MERDACAQSTPPFYNDARMEPDRIAAHLEPFCGNLSAIQLSSISTYIDMLLRWNARMNLTAVRDPEHIVTRHFGESLFAARRLFPAPTESLRVADLGSGAGFPGLPLKIWAPAIHLTLIESNHKKATFLREVIRALALPDAEVFDQRAGQFPTASADVVTLRAVERFESVLPTAASLVAPAGRLALLIGRDQFSRLPALAPTFHFSGPDPIPQSSNRVLVIGRGESRS
jgi:16S rRNA (guanine527-N7)-methyltransferase